MSSLPPAGAPKPTTPPGNQSKSKPASEQDGGDGDGDRAAAGTLPSVKRPSTAPEGKAAARMRKERSNQVSTAPRHPTTANTTVVTTTTTTAIAIAIVTTATVFVTTTTMPHNAHRRPSSIRTLPQIERARSKLKNSPFLSTDEDREIKRLRRMCREGHAQSLSQRSRSSGPGNNNSKSSANDMVSMESMR